ncbi:HAMP domain-containing sensor histidine kinase [Clostridium oceanicum]
MKKSISRKLMKNYISMYILASVLVIFVFIMLLSLSNVFNDYRDNNYAKQLIKDDYNKIDTKLIKDHNGTIFVVNKDLKVVPIWGENLPQNKSFTMSKWTDFINKIDENNRDFKCSIEYNDKNKFWLIVKMPVAVNFLFNFNINRAKGVLPEAMLILAILCLTCFLIILIYVYIYSKLTSKYFIKPLDMFCYMVKTLEKGNYRERLQIYKKDEFGALSDSFNKLADSLENEKRLRKEIEENRKRLILDISHDLKNPLTSTMGSLELCLQENNFKKQKHYLKMAYDNSIRAKALINDLFEYSKMDSEEYKLTFEKIDLCEYMRIQIASEIDAIEEAGLISEYEIPEKSIYAEIDTIHFGRVIHNLITNTIKYNKVNTKIKISLKEIDENIEIIVQDNGIGIDKKLAVEIFNRFVRENKNTQTSGTGLGLTIAKKIVTMHNGTISLKTDINRGCRFLIIIPKSYNNP